ncbi:hypothetical protein [Actinomyces vulturis]|uniref:hypothetical protein n=1 Tax=Actinomyces vulturis TaxID=1857645 RepID=UPI00082D8608|nr:hypothetical protein [Actinomyces vulturis]
MSRHPFLAQIVPLIEKIIWGKDVIDGETAWAYPVFHWIEGDESWGKKAKTTDGFYSMPLRIVYNKPSVSCENSRRLAHAIGPGHDIDLLVVPTLRNTAELRQEAYEAQWELFSLVQDACLRSVQRTVAVRAAELFESSNTDQLFDSLAIQSICDSLMLDPGGAFERMIPRICQENAFNKCDPSKWITTFINYEARMKVSRALDDDVKIGPKIRRLNATKNYKNIQELVTDFNQKNPSRITTESNAARCLSIGAIGRSMRIHDEDLFSPSAEECFLGW